MLRHWLLGLATLPSCGGFISGGALPRAPGAFAAVGTVPLSPLQVTPLEDVATRLRSVAVAWAGSLANTAMPADDLMLALVSPEAFWLLREWRRSAYGQQEAMRRALDGARRQIRHMGGAVVPLRGATVSVRSKGLWSTFHKANVRRKAVHDVLAVRVVLKGESDEDVDVYGALDAMRAEWPAVPGRFKDYVARPKLNGYQGLHDTLRLPGGRAFEVQIRTERMHRDAEFGVASHRKYKGAVEVMSKKMLAGVAEGRAQWPLQPQAALAIATRLADDN